MVKVIWVWCLDACLFPSSLLRVGDNFVHQQSPLLPVSRQPWTLCHWSVRPLSSSLPINSIFQYFSAQVSGSDHMTKILNLTSLYSCQQSLLWLQHRCISRMCCPVYPQTIVDMLYADKSLRLTLTCKDLSFHKEPRDLTAPLAAPSLPGSPYCSIIIFCNNWTQVFECFHLLQFFALAYYRDLFFLWRYGHYLIN